MNRSKAIACALPLVAALAAAVLPVADAQPPAGESAHPIFPTPPTVERLPNGLTVVTVPWDSPGIVAYYTLVRVGSRDEVEEGHSGFAHLFEHMMFRGTERFPEHEYEHAMQSFGADTNAYTTRDYTMYTITAPVSALPRIAELESDRFQRLAYSEAQFRTETGAVAGEYAKSASSPFLKMWERVNELAFRRHTYRHTTLGYLRDICAMKEKLEYSRRFFQRFYTPDNTTILAVGDVSHAQLMEVVRQNYGAWQGRRDRNAIPSDPEPRQGASAHIPWDGNTPPRMFVAYRIPSFDGNQTNRVRRARSLEETAALEIIRRLTFAESSPLYRSLVLEQQKVLELESWDRSFNRDPGIFLATSVLKPGTGFDEVLGALQAELDGIAAGRTPEARIEAVRSNLRYGLIGELEQPSDVANLLGEFGAVTGDVADLDAYLEALARVTPAQIARTARTYLTESRRYVVTLATRTEADGPAPEAGPLCPEDSAEGEASR